MKKQTSVEWLKLQLETYGDPQYCELTWKELDELCEQAKAMEREQIIDAYLQGSFNWQRKGATQFYNETYKGGEQ